MTISWPVDDYDDFEDPDATDPQNNPSHAEQHQNINAAVEALEAKVGTDDPDALTGTMDERITALEQAGFGGVVPTGVIMAWPTLLAPSGWLLCDGVAVSRATYTALHALLKDVGGTDAYAYGNGDTSTTFNTPDLKGKIPVGRHSSQTQFDVLSETGGERTHTLTTAELPTNAGIYTIGGSDGFDTSGTSFVAAGVGSAHNNLQPYLTLNYIIKT